MKRNVLVISLMALAACAHSQIGTSPQETASPDSPDTAVPVELATIHPAYITAWSGSDPAALQVYYAPDVTVVTPSGTYTTWTNVNTRWVAPLLPEHYMLTPTKFEKTGDHSIVETGKYTYTMNSNGNAMLMRGTYEYHWKQGDDGVWRIKDVTIK